MSDIREKLQPDACRWIKMYGSVVVGTKGQIVIPSEVRKDLSIEPGDTMLVITKHGKAIALIKTDDLEEFLSYMNEEMNIIRHMAQENQPKP